MIYEITTFHSINSYPTLANALFGVVKLTKNAIIDKYKYFGYGTGFDKGFYSHPSGGTGRNIIIFGVDVSSSTKIDNKYKDILILGKGPTQGLGKHSLSAEKMYSINFTKPNTKFCLSLHYNDDSYLFVNGKEIIKYKANNKNINFPTQFCIGGISDGFSANDSKEVSLNENVYDFLVDYNSIGKSDILSIHKYLMTKNNIK